jgi:hypothetical protein
VRILNICDERFDELARRKKAISYRIAVQRAELEHEFGRLRRPLHAIDKARAAGAKLAEHGPAIAMMLAPVLFLFRRPLLGGVGFAARMARKATRWWTLWKLGSKMMSGMPGFSRR